MKNKIILVACAVVSLAVSALAEPGWKTLSDGGNAASPAEVIFPADPSATWRLVTVNWASDTNNAVLSISDGGTAFTIVETNQATTSVTNKINSTNGLSASAVLVLQHAGSCYAATLSTWNSSTNSGAYGGTNVVLASGGWGVATSVGDSVYLMNTPVTLPIGATTNFQSGYSLFSCTYQGRPMRVQLTPALATNRLFSAVGRKE